MPNQPDDSMMLAVVKWLWAIVAALFAFIAKRHFDEDRKLADRISALEVTCATRADITELRESIEVKTTQILDVLLKR